MAQNRPDRLTLELGLCLDLSCLAPGPKEPLGLGPVACPAFESHLRLTFRPTLLTLEHPGTLHCQEAGCKLDDKCPPQTLSWHRHLSQPARKTISGHSTIHFVSTSYVLHQNLNRFAISSKPSKVIS